MGVGWREAAMPDAGERRRLYAAALERLESFAEGLERLPVAPAVDEAALRAAVDGIDFSAPRPAQARLEEAMGLLVANTVHAGHPRYFGLFNPPSLFVAQLADLLTAAVNPQLAVWSQAPAAVEIERRLVAEIGGLLGIGADVVAGHFTSGGAEANLTALLLALTRAEPGFAARGARAFPGEPVFYASADSHLAWLKIAHQCGLGRDAVRLVGCGRDGRLAVSELARLLRADRMNGAVPVMIVATAGTTGTGAIDPLPALADLAAAERVHLHVDAAWGGAAAFSPRLRGHLAGIGRADSITVDAHKWLSVPMGAGMFLCRDAAGLHRTFEVATSYMPEGREGRDPYTHSVQWSRRFIGLKLFLALGTLGHSGYAAMVEDIAALGGSLRALLRGRGWRVVNATPLPVVCFVDAGGRADAAAVCADVVSGGGAWLSTVRFGGETVLRACISGFRTGEADLHRLAALLDGARARAVSNPPPAGCR